MIDHISTENENVNLEPAFSIEVNDVWDRLLGVTLESEFFDKISSRGKSYGPLP